MNAPWEFIVTADEAGPRLDQYLSARTELALSRSQVHKLIADGLATVNREKLKPSYRVKTDDRIKIVVPPPKLSTVEAENIPLEIIYEDQDIIVINKPRGLVTHPAPGNRSGTLVNALLYHCDHLAELGSPLRPGIVHRLDKDTSGVMVIAKNNRAYLSLVKQIKDRTVEKTYLALVHGIIKDNSGTIEARIGRHPVNRKKMTVLQSAKAREALTYYKVIKRFKAHTLVEVKIKTGRTHQIRVHFSHLGFPLVGDQTYGRPKEELPVNGQLLHAKRLAFHHPTTEQKVSFESNLPKEFDEVIQKIA